MLFAGFTCGVCVSSPLLRESGRFATRIDLVPDSVEHLGLGIVVVFLI